MSNTYGIYNSGSVVLEYWNGVVSAQELYEHQDLQEADKRIGDDATKIVDFRDVQFQISDQDVIKFASAFSSKSNNRLMALVIQDTDWDRANLYAQKAWQDNREVIVFHSMDAACAWLDLDASNIETKINELKKELRALA